MPTPLQIEFQAYDDWNSRLQKARSDVLLVRRRRNAAFEKYKSAPNSTYLHKKAFIAEQELWIAETEYALYIQESKETLNHIHASTLGLPA